MATAPFAPSVSRQARRPIDVDAIVSESLRHEEEADELGVEESGLCRLIELNGMIGCDPELGMFA